MKLKALLPVYMLLALLWINSLVSAPGLQMVKPESRLSAQANKARFALTDFYYRDEEGKKIPLILYPKAFAVRLRPGVNQDNFTSLYKNDPRIAEFINRPDLNLLIVQVKKGVSSDRSLIEMINEFNTSSSMIEFATPIVQSQGKTLVLTNEFEAEFKSFVLPQEIHDFNRRHYLERLTVEKRDNKYDLFVLQLTPASEKNILQMVHLYEEDALVKHARPRFLSLPKPVVIRTSLSPSVASLGDPVLYRIQIIKDPEVQIEESLLSPGSINLKPTSLDAKSFKILDDSDSVSVENPTELRTEDGQILTVKDFHLVFYATGEYEIPPVSVLYRIKKEGTDQKNVETQEVQSDPVRVKVVSLLPTNMRDINGILPEESVVGLEDASKFSAYRNIFLGLALVIFSLGGVSIWIYSWMRQNKGKGLPEISEKEKAILELEKLKEYTRKVTQDPERGTPIGAKQTASPLLYEQVPLSFRRALSLFYGFNAESGSTSMVLKQLKSFATEDEIQKATRFILQEYGDKRFLPQDLRPIPTQAEVEKVLSAIQEVVQHFKVRTNHP